ncbi:MAG: TetR/AcrR family transcriptional regulator [Chloroflexota bacterium]
MEAVKRTYRSPRRDQQASETRRAIAAAALELFTEHGFTETSIRQVAQRASVSDQTIYKAFGDKIGLLCEAAAQYIETGGGGTEAAFLAALAAEPDPIERFRAVARSSRELWESGALELDLMLNGTEIRDPRLEELQRRSLAYKLESTRAACEVLFPDDIRRADFSVDDIAALGTAIDSAATVMTLRALGWSMDRWEQWMVALLTMFLDPAHAARWRGPGT